MSCGACEILSIFVDPYARLAVTTVPLARKKNERLNRITGFDARKQVRLFTQAN
jgi:hypothetical protein